MSNYTPPNSHNVNLDFKDTITSSTDLNFGVDEQKLAQIDAEINVKISPEIFTEVFSSNTIDAFVKVGVCADIQAVVGQVAQIDTRVVTTPIISIVAARVDQFCSIESSINMMIKPQIISQIDMNNLRGVSYSFNTSFDCAIESLSDTEIPWSKPILRVSNEALFFDKSLVISNQYLMGFEAGISLSNSVQMLFEQGTGLQGGCGFIWQETEKRFIGRNLNFNTSKNLSINILTDWKELIRLKKDLTYSHNVAELFQKRFSFVWDKGLEIITSSNIDWEIAKSIHYRKHSIEPWLPTEKPKYKGSADLDFHCLCLPVKSNEVTLNFGSDDCIPAILEKKWWFILNNLEVTRLDNGQKITVYDGTYSTDKNRWCWSYTLRIPYTEIVKLESINDQPVILKIMVNGFEYHMLYESKVESKRFAETIYTLQGRSPTAVNSSDYSNLRSFLQENERTSVQLCQAELDRVFSETELDWRLIDELGWIVENESLTYSNLAPVDAIKMVVDAGGGFVYSEKSGNKLTIKPRYKKSFWDSMANSDYDIVLPNSFVEQQDISSKETDFDYNGITLINSKNGKTALVKRLGTSGDTTLESETNPLFNHVSMGSFAKAKLTEANVIETHTFKTPVSSEAGEFLPGNILAFNSEWWGVIDSVSGSFSHASTSETITVERISRV